jgi:tetratricopeptide (TPR) repeat protein
VRRDLRGLQRDTADTVARHLVAAGQLVDEDPQLALEHARYARSRASRIAVVREAAGIAAYHAGEWAEALGELRAARRMGGGSGHLAVMADIERALGRPERALELSRGPEVRALDRAESIELAIVAAGARRDLGELDAAVVSLQIAELDPARRDPWSARLFYAYADNLLAAGREPDALQWFVHAADVDDDGETDAARRIAELTGEPLPEEDDIAFGVEDEPDAPDVTPSAPDDPDDEPDAAGADEVAAYAAVADPAEAAGAEVAAGSEAEPAEPADGDPASIDVSGAGTTSGTGADVERSGAGEDGAAHPEPGSEASG